MTSEEFIFLSVQVDTLPRFQLNSRSFSKSNESVRAHVQSLFPTISRSWHLVFCFLLQKDTSQVSMSSFLEGSIGTRSTYTRPQKCPKTRFLGHLTLFFSKTRANSLLPSPDSDSTGKNLSESVIIGHVPKSISDSTIGKSNSL